MSRRKSNVSLIQRTVTAISLAPFSLLLVQIPEALPDVVESLSPQWTDRYPVAAFLSLALILFLSQCVSVSLTFALIDRGLHRKAPTLEDAGAALLSKWVPMLGASCLASLLLLISLPLALPGIFVGFLAFNKLPETVPFFFRAVIGVAIALPLAYPSVLFMARYLFVPHFVLVSNRLPIALYLLRSKKLAHTHWPLVLGLTYTALVLSTLAYLGSEVVSGLLAKTELTKAVITFLSLFGTVGINCSVSLVLNSLIAVLFLEIKHDHSTS